MTMIAIGGAIGTGLFLGSGFAISLAGPAVLLSYLIGALIALLLMGCLAEMTVAHPTSGSFGAYAEYYIGPLAGFLVRYAYWTGNVLAVGTEVTAIALYMRFWFPACPGWPWIVGILRAADAGERAQRQCLRRHRVLVLGHQGHCHRAFHRAGRLHRVARTGQPAGSAGGGGQTPAFTTTRPRRLLPQGPVGRMGGGDRGDLQLFQHRDDRRGGGRGRAARGRRDTGVSFDGGSADPVLSADARAGAGDRALDRGGDRREPVRQGHARAGRARRRPGSSTSSSWWRRCRP